MNRKLEQPHFRSDFIEHKKESRLAGDLERHPNLKYCELSEEQLRKKLNQIHKFLMSPQSMLVGYVYQRMREGDDKQ